MASDRRNGKPTSGNFAMAILDRGKIDATLPDVAPEIRERIGAMPMLAWKCQHIRPRRGATGRQTD